MVLVSLTSALACATALASVLAELIALLTLPCYPTASPAAVNPIAVPTLSLLINLGFPLAAIKINHLTKKTEEDIFNSYHKNNEKKPIIY
ncbi:MAG: hypothetical protein WC821_04735 [archaeon]